MQIANTINSYMNKDNRLDIQKIVNDYTNYIYMIIRNMTKEILSEEDMEEIISDVFFVLWKNKEILKLDAPMKPYIAGVSKNIIKNRLRGLKLADSLDDVTEDNLKYEQDIISLMENKEINEIIFSILNKNKENKKIFILYNYYGKKIKEISEMLNLTEFNVATKLHRIRKKLKEVLEKRGYTYGK